MPQIQTVLFDIAAGDLAQASALLDAEASAIRARAGCLAYRPFIDASGGALIFQLWQDQAAFEAYRASPSFAALNAGLRSLMIAPPQSLTYDVAIRDA